MDAKVGTSHLESRTQINIGTAVHSISWPACNQDFRMEEKSEKKKKKKKKKKHGGKATPGLSGLLNLFDTLCMEQKNPGHPTGFSGALGSLTFLDIVAMQL